MSLLNMLIIGVVELLKHLQALIIVIYLLLERKSAILAQEIFHKFLIIFENITNKELLKYYFQ